jgi:thymidylate synthase ThyX
MRALPGTGPYHRLLVSLYVPETFTDDEADILRRYFTNLDLPVFALVNLPEVVKGALFARYSRSAKSLRRLFLDEFVVELDVDGDAGIDATMGLDRAEALYEKVFLEYGDDSVAQLGGVHLACEQSSNLLTKILERGRLASYLEQSTRYIAYDARLDGRFRYYRDPDICGSNLGTRYVGDMDRLFDTYSDVLTKMTEFHRVRFPKAPNDSDFAWRQAVRAKALDAARGILPAAAISNLGIYGSGQAYEQLLLRMRAHPLPEARQYADMMLEELRKVIPSFLVRVDRPDRGGVWSQYLDDNRINTAAISRHLFADEPPAADDELASADQPSVTLVHAAPDGEDRVIAAILYEMLDLPEARIAARVQRLTTDEKRSVLMAYVGNRRNRRHRPGRAFEATDYRFDILADYGAFRDLQRHRLMTLDWQTLGPTHGYVLPDDVEDAGYAEDFDIAMERSAELHDALVDRFPDQAPYAVSLAYRIRFIMQMNARQAMHVLELRSQPQGHIAYRRVAQEMHRLIAEQAGHRLIAEAMSHVDFSDPGLERLDAERRAEARRSAR